MFWSPFLSPHSHARVPYSPDSSIQRLTVPMVDELIADLKDAISEAKLAPTGKGTMVMLYGACTSFLPSLPFPPLLLWVG